MTHLKRKVLVGVLVALVVAPPACKKEVVSPQPNERGDGLTGGNLVFEDDFERAALGEHWSADRNNWRIDEGQLTIQDARNDALWLDLELPEQVRIEFDGTALSDEGDVKFEVFGDGETHESGYIVIFGGWSNQVSCIARLDEHGEDRLDAPQHHPLEPGRAYRLIAVRTDNQLRWYVDGDLILAFDDSDPLVGEGHHHFAFNDWSSPVRFDNLRVYDLAE